MGVWIERFLAGGFFMWFILAVQALGIALILDRFVVLKAATSIKKDELLNHINTYILQGNLDRAISVCAQVRRPLTNIVKAGLSAVANSGDPEEVQTAMDAVALREIPKLEKRIGLLATCANLATLLGLLGTVAGLIGAFETVAELTDPSQKAEFLGKSISEAMNTTAFGLMVAIPLLGAFGWLQSMAQGIIDDIHESSVSTLNFVLANRDKLKRKNG